MTKRYSTILMVMGAIALAACQKPAGDTAAVTEEMKRGATEWADAFNAGDADKVAGFYAADALLMPPNHAAVQGSDAIRQFIADESTGARNNGMKFAINSTATGVSGDLAWSSGTYTISDASGTAADEGKFLELRQNMDGKWKIIRDVWNSDRAPPAPAEAPPADAAAETPPAS